MANKFQKSVLERLEQEAVRQKKEIKIKIKDEIKETEEIPIKYIIEQPEAIATETTVPEAEEKTAAELPPGTTEPQKPSRNNEISALPDISEYLRRDNQRLAKNKTFYLDSDVIEAIKTTAKAQNVTDSKLVNDILQRVLGLR